VTRFVGVLSFVLACATACALGGHDDPSGLARPNVPDSDPDAGTSPITPPETPDAGCGQFCGQTFLHEIDDPPNLYFLVDRSGSMSVPIPTLSKYKTARKVLGELLTVIGHRVSFGATIFPTDEGTCGPGQEIFPPTLGGLPPCDGSLDPTVASFLNAFGAHAPTGETPTYGALLDLRPELEALQGDTYLVLITDGAPNCNEPDAVCDASTCIDSIEGDSFGQLTCSATFNCCDPANTVAGAGSDCIDADRTSGEIAKLAAHGIPTYVVGMPGAEPFANVLNGFAEAGGTARQGDVEYYATEDEDELQAALYAIGTGVAIRCSIDLDAPPDDPNQVNVYFDGVLVPADPTDGWSWSGDTTIQVNGAACDELKSGSVIDARAVFGCDTVVR